MARKLLESVAGYLGLLHHLHQAGNRKRLKSTDIQTAYVYDAALRAIEENTPPVILNFFLDAILAYISRIHLETLQGGF